jgi:hypothetical protein
MASLDLRFENPPLGYHAEEVPLVDTSQVDYDQNQLPLPVDKLYLGAYNIPGETSVMLQQQILHTGQGPQSAAELRAHITETNRQLDFLGRWGIGVVSRRHIEATFVKEVGDGELLSLVTRLPYDYEPLDITKSNRHLQTGLWIIDGLVKYAHAQLTDTSSDAHFLADVFNVGQYRVNRRGQQAKLQEGGSDLAPTIEEGTSYLLEQALATLHSSIDWAMEVAEGKPMSGPFAAELKQQANSLPNPLA